MAARYGDDIDEDGTLAAKAHRAWMSMKDVLTGGDADGVLDVADRGEDHAVEEFESALKEDISAELRQVVERQLAEIRTVRDKVRALRDSVS